MKENVIKTKSFAFAVRIVNVYKFLISEKKEFVMSKQLLRSGTAVGALYREAEQAESKPAASEVAPSRVALAAIVLAAAKVGPSLVGVEVVLVAVLVVVLEAKGLVDEVLLAPPQPVNTNEAAKKKEIAVRCLFILLLIKRNAYLRERS